MPNLYTYGRFRTFYRRKSRVKRLPSPQQIHELLPTSDLILERIAEHKRTLEKILKGQDHRIALCIGPCSIHSFESALEYALRIKSLIEKVKDSYFIVLRAYIEKPRTTTGWKGFLYDPFLDGSDQIDKGLFLSRNLFIEMAKLDIPIATEFLDPFAVPYIQELITWGFIGARTCTSSIHRQMASALNMPVGFKNSTDGNIDHAIQGILSAKAAHSFISLGHDGFPSQIRSQGNCCSHLVLRGGSKGPNFDKNSIEDAKNKLKLSQIDTNILIDCSHGNSNKEHRKQIEIFHNVLNQRLCGNTHIIGMMLESFLKEGQQPISCSSYIDPYISITDPCLGWDATEDLLLSTSETLMLKESIPQTSVFC